MELWFADYAMYLKAIKTGEYSSLAAGWVSGLSVANAQTTATKWASESNAAVCSTVLRQGVAFVEDNDLGGSYTTSASPVVKLQIAKQGYRYVLYCATSEICLID